MILFWSAFFLGSTPFSATASSTAVEAKDLRGKTVRLKQPAQRIVCLIESALSGLYMLGAERQIIAVSRNVYTGDVFPRYAALDERIKDRRLPAPGNWDFVNLESVVALKPDLVILWSQQTEVIENLERQGIPVFGVFIRRIEDIYQEVRSLGRLTGREKRAEDLITYTQKEVERFRSRLASLGKKERPAVYYMWAQGNLETSCGGSMVNELIALAGGVNVCGDLISEHQVVNLEKVLTWNPQVILMWYNERKDPRHILEDPQWKGIKAVKERRVYEFPEVFWSDLWTLKFLYAVKLTAKWLHPERFQDIHLEAERDKMLRQFYGRVVSGRP